MATGLQAPIRQSPLRQRRPQIGISPFCMTRDHTVSPCFFPFAHVFIPLLCYGRACGKEGLFRQIVATAVPILAVEDFYPPYGIQGSQAQRVVLPVTPKYTHDVPTRSSGAEQGQAMAEYATMLAVLLGLLALLTAIGIHVSQMLDWISSNMY